MIYVCTRSAAQARSIIGVLRIYVRYSNRVHLLPSGSSLTFPWSPSAKVLNGGVFDFFQAWGVDGKLSLRESHCRLVHRICPLQGFLR